MSKLKNNVDRADNYHYYKSLCKKISKYPQVAVSCPVCLKNNIKRNIFIKIYEMEYVQCDQCDHIYQDYLPDEKILSEITSKVSQRMSKQLYEDKFKNLYRIQNIAKPKIEFILQHFTKNYKGSWLDVGCGTGELIKIIKDYGWDVCGIDNNKSSIEYAREKYDLNIIYADVEKVDNNIFNKYDIISIFLLFEHLRFPRAFFNNIAKGCKKGAMIIIEINNADSLSTLVQRAFPNKIDRHFLPCSHTNMFTYKSLNYFFNMFGFEIISEWWFGQDFYELMIAIDNNEIDAIEKLLSISNEMQKNIDKIKKSDRLICIFQKQ